MNNEQQVRVLLEAINAHGPSYTAEVLENVLRFIFECSNYGNATFSIEALVGVILGDE